MTFDIFDILGPIAVGPSSSHTAGAGKIGQACLKLLGEEVKKATIIFYGSFSETYKGHGTDKAIIGGLLGFDVSDEKICNSIEIAKERGMEYTIKTATNPQYHPNTVVIEAQGATKSVRLRASSIGGGNIMLDSLNGVSLGIRCKLDTIILPHYDVPGVMANVTRILLEAKHNLANLMLSRSQKGGDTVAVIEMDDAPTKETLEELRKVDNICDVIYVPKL